MRRLALIVALSLFAASLFAASLFGLDGARAATPNDFACGIQVTPQTAAAVQRFAIPAAVYEQVTSPVLADVALFNEALEPVPFAIHRPSPQRRWEPWQALPVFPLARARNDRTRSRVEVTLADSGAIVAIDGTTGPDAGSVTIIDASAFDHPIDELELTWQPMRAGAIIRARIELGTELGHWHTVVADAAFATLEAGGHRIEQNRVAFGGREARYLRVSTTLGANTGGGTNTGGGDPRVTGARVRRATAGEPDRAERSATGLTVTTDADGILGIELDTGGRFPVESVRVSRPDQPTHALEVDVFSRADPDDDWQWRGRHLFFRTSVDGVAQKSAALETGHIAHRYWRVRPHRGAFSAPELLQLHFTWVPHEVVFLTQGAGNFVLAFGSSSPPEARWTLTDLVRMQSDETAVNALPRALTGALYELGGPSRTMVSRSVPWQRLALWAVLMLGVLLVGSFGWQLVRASSTAPGSTGSDDGTSPAEPD